MTERTPGGEEAMALEVIARDDLLLDALGRGEEASTDDGIAAMLAAWRADVAAEVPEPAELRPPTPTGDGGATEPPVPLAAARSRRSRPWALRLAAAVVAVLALVSGLGISSRNAGPSSPLWTLTKLLYPQQAEVRGVEETIARARAALTAGRFDEAQRLVDQARRELTGITDPATVDRLREQLDALTRQLVAERADAAPPATPPVTPAPSSAPLPGPTARATQAPVPAPKPTKPGTGSTPGGSATGGGGDPLLPLPRLPLPPLPSPSLLSPLPGLPLPLPTSGLLG
ncbi:anti-sigma-D factor RsdA [Micromonospora inositola]|uniref:Anti-sigma-D factor RsdA to sigma factor binding region n=1 Tax=Micromonospora inositola TaxID=47865 RepID=A0A1C5JKC7_9ACTN|nr:anti-sigma-D factor RsdA [Micromonospora inositola]SCG70669.1 Anti-sigma-D factor RsdA to sigma factor binding region [Micromonospora inositola]